MDIYIILYLLIGVLSSILLMMWHVRVSGEITLYDIVVALLNIFLFPFVWFVIVFVFILVNCAEIVIWRR